MGCHTTEFWNVLPSPLLSFPPVHPHAPADERTMTQKSGQDETGLLLTANQTRIRANWTRVLRQFVSDRMLCVAAL